MVSKCKLLTFKLQTLRLGGELGPPKVGGFIFKWGAWGGGGGISFDGVFKKIVGWGAPSPPHPYYGKPWSISQFSTWQFLQEHQSKLLVSILMHIVSVSYNCLELS